MVWELNPVAKGDGGTLLVPGSHKATFPAPASIHDPESNLWREYECPPGSALIFTESLTHSAAVGWKNTEYDRVAIFHCYNALGHKWHKWEPHPDQLKAMPPKRQSLFRPVYCENNMSV